MMKFVIIHEDHGNDADRSASRSTREDHHNNDDEVAKSSGRALREMSSMKSNIAMYRSS